MESMLLRETKQALCFLQLFQSLLWNLFLTWCRGAHPHCSLQIQIHANVLTTFFLIGFQLLLFFYCLQWVCVCRWSQEGGRWIFMELCFPFISLFFHGAHFSARSCKIEVKQSRLVLSFTKIRIKIKSWSCFGTLVHSVSKRTNKAHIILLAMITPIIYRLIPPPLHDHRC